MLLVYRYRVKSLTGLLNRQARACNLVWNFCNDTQRYALKWKSEGRDVNTRIVASSGPPCGEKEPRAAILIIVDHGPSSSRYSEMRTNVTPPVTPPELWELPLPPPPRPADRLELGAGETLLTGYAAARAAALIALIEAIGAAAPFRRMVTPGGWRMSVAMTNCGPAGWVNRYEPGARMSLHQDKDERDVGAPIVSVSLGLPALFLWGGLERSDRPRRVPLLHGDVVVWGGPSRLTFHGVHPLPAGVHPFTGALRYNLTFRKAR
jgi:alkylated DNA repair protein (DNA oxidative demethylase)